MAEAAARPSRPGAAAPGEMSWFGAMGIDVAPTDDDELHSRYDRGDWPADDAPDSRFLSRQARRIAGSGLSGLQRMYRAFVAARAVLGVALLGTEVLITWIVPRTDRGPVLTLCAVYAFLTLALWLLPQLLRVSGNAQATRLRRREWIATIGVDVVVFGTLHLITGGAALNYSALLVLPALMAGVLTPRLQALGVASAGALVLLIDAGLAVGSGQEATVLMTQAGLAGTGLFVVSLLAGELAGRLAREERTARGSLELARQQAQLNRLVLDEMQDGVLVVDKRGRVRAANPAARTLIGEPELTQADSFALAGVPAWQPLVRALDGAFSEGAGTPAGRDVVLPLAGGPRELRLRVRFIQRRQAQVAEEFCVVFVEDLRSLRLRARQEKLAAMGRVSAGIAHEIRNPLAAIMQANALLAEDADTAQQRQLTRMVADNAERLKRIVDDVMEVAPGQLQEPPPLDATSTVGSVCSEWARTSGLAIGPDSAVQVELPGEPLGAAFDGEHLRRVLVNLLDNALRHGSGLPGAVRVRLAPRGNGVVLAVRSDGASIPPEIERHLFEPFFSSRSRGTGLGLYICRELCERYGASIEYRARDAERHRNEFTVTMRRAALAASEHRLHLGP